MPWRTNTAKSKKRKMTINFMYLLICEIIHTVSSHMNKCRNIIYLMVSKAGFVNQHGARWARFIRMAQMSGSVGTFLGSVARVVTGRRFGPTRHRWVNHSSATVASQLLKTGLPAPKKLFTQQH